MNGSEPIDSELLASYLAGEASASERETVERWAAADAKHALELAQMRRIWGLGAEGLPVPEVDVDRAWDRTVARMDAAEGRGRVIPLGRRARMWRFVAAAVVIAGVVFAVRFLFGPSTERLVADTSSLSATLADSSRVTLLPGTRITARMGAERQVALNGRAYFEVTKDPEHPFVVEAGALTVTVLGTSFEVTAYDTATSMQVRVREGRVQVVTNNDTLVLVSGEHARFDRARQVLAREAAGPVERWGGRILQFEQAPLSLVVRQLRERYGVEVELANEAIGRCALTATFEEEPVEQVLQVVAATFGLQVEPIAPGRYMLIGDGC
jgi:ferric-dicitrate binding protein FerR (iron transport regulator)